MNSKQYLKQLRLLKSIIKTKQEQLQSLREMATNITPNYSVESLKTSSICDKMGNAVVKILDLEKELAIDIEKLTNLSSEIIYKVNLMPDADLQQILTYKYISFYTWEQIAERMDYSLRWVYELHQRALLAFEVVMKLS